MHHREASISMQSDLCHSTYWKMHLDDGAVFQRFLHESKHQRGQVVTGWRIVLFYCQFAGHGGMFIGFSDQPFHGGSNAMSQHGRAQVGNNVTCCLDGFIDQADDGLTIFVQRWDTHGQLGAHAICVYLYSYKQLPQFFVHFSRDTPAFRFTHSLATDDKFAQLIQVVVVAYCARPCDAEFSTRITSTMKSVYKAFSKSAL